MSGERYIVDTMRKPKVRHLRLSEGPHEFPLCSPAVSRYWLTSRAKDVLALPLCGRCERVAHRLMDDVGGPR